MIYDLRQKSGWSVLYGAALAASFCPMVYQLLFATVAIGLLGMAHGASDLAVIRRGKKRLFLSGYLALMALCLLVWQTHPASALPVFLVASAGHFAIEEPQASGWPRRLAIGIGLITLPAVFYLRETTVLLSDAGFPTHSLALVMTIMQGVGILCAAQLFITGSLQRDYRILAGVLSLLFFPPLIGFSLGFLILHAFPQTRVRRHLLGCNNYYDYLRLTWPILSGALLFSLVAIIFILPEAKNNVRILFTLLTALSLPHLIITPLFESSKN
ncbi:Brp/Blh family beta-carotene 15,15'-dioxygenase [Rosenbergiella epipactidis]|uniref:Brp/Blh family beta-carotene 15,15'-dioxygenase n=1 Tax=Rosenbergiella epipactidis TaxID=1544694 RepID=UPI001F4E44AE|nr:Brp/Blh family beta-carotene 15,15'-dioxygenase [Rosenbergiella epipactidis]